MLQNSLQVRNPNNGENEVLPKPQTRKDAHLLNGHDTIEGIPIMNETVENSKFVFAC